MGLVGVMQKVGEFRKSRTLYFKPQRSDKILHPTFQALGVKLERLSSIWVGLHNEKWTHEKRHWIDSFFKCFSLVHRWDDRTCFVFSLRWEQRCMILSRPVGTKTAPPWATKDPFILVPRRPNVGSERRAIPFLLSHPPIDISLSLLSHCPVLCEGDDTVRSVGRLCQTCQVHRPICLRRERQYR